MYDMKRLQKETSHKNGDDDVLTSRVSVVVVMEMVDKEKQSQIETALEEFFEKVKSLVPDDTLAQGN